MAEAEIMKERKRWAFLGLPFTFTKYVITDKRIVIETGLFVSKESEILHYRILDMNYSRNLLQKMFGLGTISLYAQDITHPELVIKNIKNSRKFKETLAELAEKEKQRLSVRRGEVVGSMMTHNHVCNDCDLDDSIDNFDYSATDE
ncbi:MAG: PH domain-containing protein [Acutalibacteraceae bacterium]|nr:PH domain-containing protein [Acutalibacteraceae bacterium]